MTERLKQGYEPIAIVGIGCRFPGGVSDVESFWNLVREGVDAVTEVPADRWDTKRFYHPNRKKPGTTDSRWGGFLDDVDKFDPEFFGISPREAGGLDPQQRLMLEVTWEALEDAGFRPEQLTGSNTGVFVGCFTTDYQFLQVADQNIDFLDTHSTSGFMMTLNSNRISYAFDFQGPSMTLDTACSSSLVAVHLACQSLITGESNLALAGGVNIMVTPHLTIAESKGGFLSPDGRSKAFDSRANGYVRAEGCGMVVLKRLEEAIADGDPIYAVIAGSACNQDGRSAGVTVPNGLAQEQLMRDALNRAGIEPSQVQYVEAHGTGTPVGDPIEAKALGTVLSEDRPDGEYCWVGSVKTNIGHTEGAAGVAGLIKAALCLQNEEIPPHLHLLERNPNIDLDGLKLRVPTTVQPWEKTSVTRYAGVNSFGFGGTNAHVILAEAPEVKQAEQADKEEKSKKAPAPSAEQDLLIPLSARTPEALVDVASSYREALGAGGMLEHVSLSDLAYSTAEHRGHHPQRMALVASNKDELLEALDAVITSEPHPRAIVGATALQKDKPRKLAFVYTGMGPQWWGMGRQLYNEEPVFRATLEACDRAFQKSSGWSLLEEMLKDESESRMGETQISQPANLFVQIGLTDWWRSKGIEPEAVVGHSAGEAAASYAAGILSLEEAVRIVYHRSRLQQTMTGQGTMVAVGLSESQVREHMQGFEDRVNLGAVNSPNGVTLAGEPEALAEMLKPLQDADVFVRYLKVGMAFHSYYMNPIYDEFLGHLEGAEIKNSKIPYYSSVLGVQSDICELGTHYWWRNLRDTVQFAEAVLSMIEDGYDTFIEIGPHPVLAASVRECLALKNRTADVLPSIRRAEAERPQLMSSLGALYTLGFEPNWSELIGQAEFVRLPRYAWQYDSYWYESSASRRLRLGEDQAHPLLQLRMSTASPAWESSIDEWRLPYLSDHRVRGAVVYPGAAYVEMGMAAARTLFSGQAVGFEVSDVSFEKALFVNEEAGDKVQLHFNAATGRFEVYSAGFDSDPVWSRHASGTVRPQPATAVRKVDVAAWREQCTRPISKQEAYAHFSGLGLEYGPLFQGMEQLWQGQGVAFAELRMPEPLEAEAGDYVFHPAMLDIALQMMAAVMPFDGDGRSALFMPVGISHAVLRQAPTSRMWAFARLDEHTDSLVRGSITVVDEQGNIVLELTDLIAQSLQADGDATLQRTTHYAEFMWTPGERKVKEEEAGVLDAAGTWLLFADGSEVADRLAQFLRDYGGTPVMVRPGTEFKRLDQGEYLVRVDQAEDYQRLLEQLTADGLACRGVAHLWSLNQTGGDAMQSEGAASVLLLVQALAAAGEKHQARLWLVTRGAQPVDGSETLTGISQSALWGLGRVIGHQEHQDIWGGLIDLDSNESSASADAQNLLLEFLQGDGEDQVVYRRDQRFVGRLQDSGDLSVPIPPVFRPDGAYMITGAFGGIGLLVANWLLDNGARRLILVGREAFPARREWDKHAADSRIGQRIQAIRDLESRGASVHITGFDIADEASLQDFLRSYEEEGWPAIRGVFHSAGTATPQMLAQMSLEDLQSVMRPKVRGALNLHEAFKNQQLDLFVLFSSMAAQVVSAGQGNYSAGNAYLDALARYRQAQGLAGLSVNWGSWADVGMATNLDLLDFFERRGIFPLLPDQGVKALGHLLAHNRPQITVAALDWATVVQNNYPNGTCPVMLADIAKQIAEADGAEGNANAGATVDFATLYRQTGDEERQELLTEQLSGMVSQVLRVPRAKLQTERSLQAYGLDSMMAIELKGRLEKTLGASIAIVDLIRGMSVNELSTVLRPQVDEWTLLSSADLEEELMSELGELSDDELDALLAEIAATKEE